MQNIGRVVSRVALCVSLGALASAAQAVENVPYVLGMELGSGFDLNGGVRSTANCVEFVQRPDTPLPFSNIHMTLITSAEEVFREMNMDAAVSGGFGPFKASAALKMAEETKKNAYSANFLVNVVAHTRLTAAKEVRPKSGMTQLLQEDPKKFFELCGDRYVSGIQYGGRMYGLYSEKTSNESERAGVAYKLEGSYGLSVKGSFSREVNKGSSIDLSNKTVRVTEEGGSALEPADIALDHLIPRAQLFSSKVKNQDVPLIVVLSKYPGAESLSYTALGELGMAEWGFASLIADIQYIKEHPDQFHMDRGQWLPHLDKMKRQFEGNHRTVRSEIEQCVGQGKTKDCKRLSDLNLKAPGEYRVAGYLPKRFKSPSCEVVVLSAQNAAIPVKTTFRSAEEFQNTALDQHPNALAQWYTGVLGKPDNPENPNDKSFSLMRIRHFPFGTPCGGRGIMRGAVKATAEAALEKANDKVINVRVKTKLEATQPHKKFNAPDLWTCESHESVQTLFNLEDQFPGCYISDLSQIEPNRGSAQTTGAVGFGGMGLIEVLSCLSDVQDDFDRGKIGCDVFLRGMRAKLLRDEERTPPPPPPGMTASQGPPTQMFSDPKTGGYLVDICLHWGDQCGEPAASAWCRTKQYDRATNWTVYTDIGDQRPTMVMGDSKVCNFKDCDGFSSITCAK